MDSKTKSARAALRASLKAQMEAHASLRTRETVARRAGVSARTVGYLLQLSGPSPRLDVLERVAAAFGLRAWELLIDPDEDRDRVIDRLFRR